ncbi:DExH-box ATP-dependent RNA helicase DExH8 [Linum grandiflorum]
MSFTFMLVDILNKSTPFQCKNVSCLMPEVLDTCAVSDSLLLGVLALLVFDDKVGPRDLVLMSPGLLRKSLDPPSPEVVEDALDVLVSMKALDKTYPSGRCVPTFYGQLLASFSLPLDAAVLIVKFGSIGLLREGVILAVLMDTVPVPIVNPFGEDHLYTEYACNHYGGYCNNTVKLGKKEMLFLGNLNAYQFWQRVFKDKQRIERLKHISECERNFPLRLMIEEEWCSFHNLVQPALQHVSERYEDIMSSLHRFRPEFLSHSDGLPVYYEPDEYNHTCHIQCQPPKDSIVSTAENDQQQEGLTELCIETPFVSSDQFKTIDIARNLSNIIKQVFSILFSFH